MKRQFDPREVNHVVLGLAGKQYGVVSLDGLRRRGVTRAAVRARVDAGWLRRVHRGVFAVAGTVLTIEGTWMAAVLACGEGAVLSHGAAAALWRIHRGELLPVDVTVPTRAGVVGSSEGIRVHRPRRPPPTIEQRGIPVTTPARTILDLAATRITWRRLERASDEAERLRLCSPIDLREIAQQNTAVPGAKRLLRTLTRHEPGSTFTRSRLEEEFLALVRERKLPAPLVNTEVLGYEVDFLWPGSGVVVETDGGGSHLTRRAFQEDRDRDSLLVAHGYRVLRFTWWDVVRRRGVVAHRVRQALGAK